LEQINPNIESDKIGNSYFEISRTSTYGFLLALPLLLTYEVLIWFSNGASYSGVRISAEVWMKRILVNFGASSLTVLGLAVIAIGFAIIYLERKKDIPIRSRYFFWMIGESVVYAIVLGLAVGTTVGFIFNAHPAPSQEMSFLQQVALSLGAGLYEELLFRVVLVSGVFYLINLFGNNSTRSYIITAIIAAAIFSWVHYTGSLGDTFTLSSFTFRFLFGLALNALYIVRGFGVAAWTHAIYDLSIVFGIWKFLG